MLIELKSCKQKCFSSRKCQGLDAIWCTQEMLQTQCVLWYCVCPNAHISMNGHKLEELTSSKCMEEVLWEDGTCSAGADFLSLLCYSSITSHRLLNLVYSMSQHINNNCKTAYIQIRHISSIYCIFLALKQLKPLFALLFFLVWITVTLYSQVALSIC